MPNHEIFSPAAFKSFGDRGVMQLMQGLAGTGGSLKAVDFII
jgi:hypothetical protein